MKAMKLNVEKIENQRKYLNMSVKDIADKMEMSRQSYYDILNSGSTKLSTITLLAEILELKGNELLIEE
jgi:predicted DNA-binding protein (UPF0251 family)